MGPQRTLDFSTLLPVRLLCHPRNCFPPPSHSPRTPAALSSHLSSFRERQNAQHRARPSTITTTHETQSLPFNQNSTYTEPASSTYTPQTAFPLPALRVGPLALPEPHKFSNHHIQSDLGPFSPRTLRTASARHFPASLELCRLQANELGGRRQPAPIGGSRITGRESCGRLGFGLALRLHPYTLLDRRDCVNGSHTQWYGDCSQARRRLHAPRLPRSRL